MNIKSLIRAAKINIGNQLKIEDWMDYPPIEFTTLEEMEDWFEKKTMDYAKKLVPGFKGGIKVRFHVFPATVEMVSESWRVTKVVNGNCESRIHLATGKVKNVIIRYNQKIASRMCIDCLENLIIHEVLHIRYPVHGECFQRAYRQALKDKCSENVNEMSKYMCVTCIEKNKEAEYRESTKKRVPEV